MKTVRDEEAKATILYPTESEGTNIVIYDTPGTNKKCISTRMGWLTLEEVTSVIQALEKASRITADQDGGKYRLLSSEEIIVTGDEVYHPMGGVWQPTPESRIGCVADICIKVRRLVEK